MKLLAIIAALMLLAASQAGATIRIVQIVDLPSGEFGYSPPVIWAAAGDTVRWVNNTAVTHTATGGTSGPFATPDPTSPIQSPDIGPAGSYQVQINNLGTYKYFCGFHLYMGAQVRVTTAKISIRDFFFTPASVTVAVGDTVLWTNDGSFTHTTTSGTSPTPDGTWASGNLGHNGTFRYIPGAPGSHPFFCSIHTSMTGTVTVNAATGVGPGGTAYRTRLLPARPNPARRTVALGYELAASQQTQLVVLDAAGRRVATLVDGLVVAGPHTVDWNGRAASGRLVSAGTYYYRLSSGGRSTSRSFTWLR